VAAAARIAGAEDRDEVARILAAAFSDDPLLTWIFGDPDRDAKLACFFGFLAREELVGLGVTYLLADSAACWTPPGTPAWPADKEQAFAASLAEVCTPEERRRLAAVDAASKAVHPTEPHWYLSNLGSAPPARNQGMGSALLRASLEVVDEAGLPAYLESSNPRNLTLYQRHGFEATGLIKVPGGPPLTPMWRPAG